MLKELAIKLIEENIPFEFRVQYIKTRMINGLPGSCILSNSDGLFFLDNDAHAEYFLEFFRENTEVFSVEEVFQMIKENLNKEEEKTINRPVELVDTDFFG